MNLRNNMNSKFLQVMLERGFIQDCTNLTILDEILTKTPASTAYVGYDATAKSLHVGHLVNIMMLRWFQKPQKALVVINSSSLFQQESSMLLCYCL